MQKHLNLFLILFIFCIKGLVSQNITLEVIGENDSTSLIITNYGYNKNHNDYTSIKNELDSLQSKLYREGHIQNKLNYIKKNNDSLFTAEISLNRKFNSIKINYNPIEVNEKTIKLITDDYSKNSFTIPFKNIEQSLQLISSKITKDGHPFSKLRLSSIEIKDDTSIEASLVIIKNKKKRSLDKVIIKGYEKFPKSFLKRFLKIKPEKTFNIETIKKKINTINNLTFANQTKEPEVLFTKDSTTLYLYIEKTISNTFDGFLGFSSNEENGNIDFNGYLNLNLNNNLNYGESLSLLYKNDESEQKNFEVKLSLPYLFSSPIGTELELNIFKKDTTFTTVNQKASLFYQLDAKSKIYLGIETTESNNLLTQDDFNEIDDYKSNFYKVKYNFTNRKNYNVLYQLNTSLDVEIGLGNRIISETKEKQIKAIISAHHIFNLNNKNSVYIGLNSGNLISDHYLENELMRFGGINSIRGFKENSLLATSFGVLNTEYRYNLSNSIYVHSIIDYSFLRNSLINQKENLYGFGFGFGILTKAGLLKFNYANGKTENQLFKFSNSNIHLSLTAIF